MLHETKKTYIEEASTATVALLTGSSLKITEREKKRIIKNFSAKYSIKNINNTE